MSESDEAAVEAVAQAIHGDECDHPLTCSMPIDRYYKQASAALATPVVADWRRDAERLRNLAARFEGHLNRGQTYTGAQIAAMLRGDGA